MCLGGSYVVNAAEPTCGQPISLSLSVVTRTEDRFSALNEDESLEEFEVVHAKKPEVQTPPMKSCRIRNRNQKNANMHEVKLGAHPYSESKISTVRPPTACDKTNEKTIGPLSNNCHNGAV